MVRPEFIDDDDDLLMFVVRCSLDTDWFQMLFKINSIFFGNTAFVGSHFVRVRAGHFFHAP